MIRSIFRFPRRLSLALAICYCAGATGYSQHATFRVMSYNIHHGEGLDGKVDLKRIAERINSEKADIVALQEVDRGVRRTAGRDLPAELAELTGMEVHFERNIPYQGGDYGNAVLTRFPIISKKNTHFKMLREGEQRGVLQLILEVQGRKLLFMNTHLDYRPDDSERLLNVDQMKQVLTEAGVMPVILCGDFNAAPGSRTHVRTKEFLSDTWELAGCGDGFTFPSGKPSKRIDYIWITEATVEPLKIQVLRSEASDHLPVAAEFRLR